MHLVHELSSYPSPSWQKVGPHHLELGHSPALAVAESALLHVEFKIVSSEEKHEDYKYETESIIGTRGFVVERGNIQNVAESSCKLQML